MRLLDERLGVADDAGQQARDGLDDGQHGHLSPVEDVVPERHERHGHALRGILHDPLVDALVTAARERQPRLGGEVARHGLGERHTGWGGDEQARRGGVGRGGDEGVERLAPRLGAHDHARSPAIGRVVDGPVSVVGVFAQVVDAHVEQPLLACLADERELQRREVVGEDRHDVDPHDGLRAPAAPGAGR